MKYILLLLIILVVQGFQEIDAEDLLEQTEVPPSDNEELSSEIHQGIDFCSKNGVSIVSHSEFPELSHLSPEENGYFKTYFTLDYYFSNSSFTNAIKIIDTTIIKGFTHKVNKMFILENEKSPNHVYIGIGKEEKGEIKLKQVVGFSKTEIKEKPKWYMDFKFTTEDAFCYFCDNNIVKSSKCKFYFELKNWGGVSTVMSKSFIANEEGFFKMSDIFMKGGRPLDTFNFELVLYFLYLLIPVLSFTITSLYQLLQLNKRGTPFVSCLGFYITIGWIYSVISFESILTILCAPSVLVLVITCFPIILILTAYGGFNPFVLPLILNDRGRSKGGPPGEDINPYPLIIYAVYWIFISLFVPLLANQWVFYGIYLSPNVYFWLNNAYILNIIMNILGKKAMCDFTPCMILNSFFIGIYPFTVFGPTYWASKYDQSWLVQFFLYQIILIAILHIQFHYGSRFFLPSRFRVKKYDNFLYKLQRNSPEVIKREQCALCLNLLSEPELEYSDADPKYNYQKFDCKGYILTPCNHKFHPNCILKSIERSLKCPVCSKILPKNDFDD